MCNDERTNKLLELFNFGNDNTYIFKGLDWDAIYNIELNEFDSWRLFNYFQDLFSRFIKFASKHMKYQVEKTIIFKKMMEEYSEDIKMFILKDIAQKKFLIDLKSPKKITEELKLPFDKIFLDTDIKINKDIRVFGILGMFYSKEGIEELNNKSMKIINKKISNTKSNILGLRFLCAKNDIGGPLFFFDDCLYDLKKGTFIKRPALLFHDGKDKDTDFKTHEILQRKITSFITNILLFFNEPRVVTYVFNRPQKNRVKKGLIPIPSEIRTKIHIDLQNYIENIYFTGQSHSKLGFAYWCMGHWRILHSNYYVNKKGQKIWIPFHLRGEGLIPPQVFEIIK